MSKPSTRSDIHLDEAKAVAQKANLSSSVGKPAYGQGHGAYGLSAGPGATRKLDFVGDNKHPQHDFQSKFSARKSFPDRAGTFNHRVDDNQYGDYRNKVETGVNQNYEEVTDGYTEYFSQGCDYHGQLGHGQDPSQHDRNRFVNVPKSLSFDILIREVSCGGSHTLILSK